MNIETTLQWIKERKYKNLPYNIEGASVGHKVKNGERTDEVCLILRVKEKLPLNLLSQDQIIPKNLELNNDFILTDVQETIINQKLATIDCHAINESIEPVKSNRIRYRPLVGGISSINIGSSDATLGLIVRDKSDGQIVALSNSHVYAGSQVSTGVIGIPTNELGSNNTFFLSARQPASPAYNSYGNLDASIDYVGTCKRPVLIGNIDPSIVGGVVNDTSCDAAIVQLSSYNLINTLSSGRVVNFNVNPPFQFATDSEITSLVNPSSPNYRSPIFRSGRTCGPVGFPGFTSSTCRLSVFELGTSLVGDYSGYVADFSDCFYVDGTVIPGRGGDSGSAMFALLSSNVPSASAWKMIGLLFAGPGDSSYTIGCRITNIVRDLDIIPWNLTMPTVSSNNQLIIHTSKSPTVTLSGRKYFQIGGV